MQSLGIFLVLFFWRGGMIALSRRIPYRHFIPSEQTPVKQTNQNTHRKAAPKTLPLVKISDEWQLNKHAV